MFDWDDYVHFGSGGSAQALGGASADEPRRRDDLRKLKSVSEAYCKSCERDLTKEEIAREPMGFKIPR